MPLAGTRFASGGWIGTGPLIFLFPGYREPSRDRPLPLDRLPVDRHLGSPGEVARALALIDQRDWVLTDGASRTCPSRELLQPVIVS